MTEFIVAWQGFIGWHFHSCATLQDAEAYRQCLGHKAKIRSFTHEVKGFNPDYSIGKIKG